GKKHLVPGINQEYAKNIKQPVKTLHQRHAYRNKNDTEYDGHQDADKQHPAIMLFLYTKRAEYQDEYKNIIHAQAPLHQVGAQVLQRGLLTILNPHKYTKGERQA